MRMAPLNDYDLQALEKRPLVAKIATVSPRGDIRITPAWFTARDESFLINTFEDTEVVKNLRKNPTCSLLIDSTEWPYMGVHYWGTATIEGPENDIEGIAEMFAPYDGGIEGATEHAKLVVGIGKRVYVLFRPERKTTWDFHAYAPAMPWLSRAAAREL